jgi:hypothetical protein
MVNLVILYATRAFPERHSQEKIEEKNRKSWQYYYGNNKNTDVITSKQQ